jgi:ribonuclease VapC
MFIDTSVIVAILSDEEDAKALAVTIEAAPIRMTSALVILEAVMRLSSKLDVEPMDAASAVDELLREADIEVVAIDHADGRAAARAFADYGKGRGHPAQLNLADCLSYACAKNRGVPLHFKGRDFARTDAIRPSQGGETPSQST